MEVKLGSGGLNKDVFCPLSHIWGAPGTPPSSALPPRIAQPPSPCGSAGQTLTWSSMATRASRWMLACWSCSGCQTPTSWSPKGPSCTTSPWATACSGCSPTALSSMPWGTEGPLLAQNRLPESPCSGAGPAVTGHEFGVNKAAVTILCWCISPCPGLWRCQSGIRISHHRDAVPWGCSESS